MIHATPNSRHQTRNVKGSSGNT
ncbi:hypothetical protein E2C01_070893 [Portunus trituberculatus]|uniref:Uncharacterized protein n=1 Tax=Portunus trituberculatus TaxID=210409 RepID=A0A5B7I3S1_PORTR|nr:hypothetical protein [Portunus trituberculatus]